jgi:CubicO group peptidase (beta-lactamase class C family)
MRTFAMGAVTAAALLLGSAPAPAVAAPPADPAAGGPPTVTASDIRFSADRLHYGSPASAGLDPAWIDRIDPDLRRFLQPSPTYPEYAGAVALAAHDGTIVAHDAVGDALRYADDRPTELPPDQRIPMRNDTIFDLASMSKLFTSIAAVQLIQAGRIDLDAPVAQYIPAFAANGKGDITIRNLLTHTSGLEPDPVPSLCTYPTHEQQWAALYAVKPAAPPDTTYVYSDENLMMMGKVIEAVTGRTLDRVVEQGITRPLHLTDTMYNPPAALRPRIAAEEYQPWTDRGIVWGSVHDENAYCVGGVSGHAGVFSTAHDLAVLAQTLLDGGRYGGARILSRNSVRLLFTDFNQAFPDDSHGLGFELDQRWYMDALSSPVTAGHTGYTGTSIVIDPLSHSFVILLTNRVHPSRNWGSNNPSRRAVAHDLGMALPVRPAAGRTAWFSGTHDASTTTLTATLPTDSSGRLDFALWYDTESTDVGRLEASTDDGATWQPLPVALHAGAAQWTTGGTFSGFEGRRWLAARAQLPAGTDQVRWSYTTDPLYSGRGIYVDRVRVTGPSGPVFDGERDAEAFTADGWSVASR